MSLLFKREAEERSVISSNETVEPPSTIMAKPIWGFTPPGGWHYYESDVRLDAITLDQLYETVTNYRAENHLPLGDVEGDVNSFLCSNYPTHCHGVDMVAITSVSIQSRSSELLQDITIWARNLVGSRNQHMLVSDDLAEQRAKICKACPNNVAWKSGCKSCIIAADRLSTGLRQARDTKTSKALGGCKQLRHDNRTAIFFDRSHFNTPADLNPHCWLNKY